MDIYIFVQKNRSSSDIRKVSTDYCRFSSPHIMNDKTV